MKYQHRVFPRASGEYECGRGKRILLLNLNSKRILLLNSTKNICPLLSCVVENSSIAFYFTLEFKNNLVLLTKSLLGFDALNSIDNLSVFSLGLWSFIVF